MSDAKLEDLRRMVINMCDSLYAERQLITKKSVISQIVVSSDWSHDELEHWVPQYINSWRLANIETAESAHQEHTIELEAAISKYRASLQHAELEISKLRAELVAQREMNKMQRARIIQGLRSMLGNGCN